MDESLKIVIKATLDKNTEQEINNQVKNLKIEPIDIKINLNQKNSQFVQATEDLFKQLNNKAKSFSSEIIKHFGITSKESIKEIRKASEEYVDALKIDNPEQIAKSYDNLFNKIKDSFYRFKTHVSQEERGFLEYFKGNLLYIDEHTKNELKALNEYDYYRYGLSRLFTTNKNKGISPDMIYEDILFNHPGIVPANMPFNEVDVFKVIADKIISIRKKLKETFSDEEIYYMFGSDQDIKNAIDNIFDTAISSINKNEQKLEQTIKSNNNKLENILTERQKEYEILDIKADKAGIELNPEYIDKFYEAIDSRNLEESRHALSMLQKEWRALNAAMEKEMPNTALENMKKNISLMPIAIESVEIRLKRLSNPSQEIQDKVANLRVQLDSLGKTTSNDEQLAIYSKLKQNILSINKELNNQIQIQRQLSREQNLLVDKQTFLNRINIWLQENSKAAKQFGEDINKIKVQLQNADSLSFGNLKKQFTEIQTQAKSLGLTGKTIVEQIVDSFKNLTSILFGGSLVMYVTNSLKEVYNNVVAIDSAMVNVKKVTDETSQAYNNFASQASKAAVKLGVGTTEIMNATADFARLGYKLQDAFTLSQNAALYRNVSYTDIGTATQNIVSTMKAFNIEAKDSTKIIDKLNEVGNRFSISSAGLGEGLRNSASSLATANNTLDESLGLITAANEVIQDPSEAGNAVKILALRLRNTKGELEKIGETTEGMVESVTKLQTQLLNLTNGKVNIMANPDTFKSTYQIMKELASVWDELTDVKRASIIELIAGKQRGNTITSILQNMKTASEVVDVSLNSAGSAMREQEKRMDSINAKIEQLKANVEGLSTSILDSSLIKFFVDLGSKGVTSLTSIIDKFGALSVILTSISTIRNFTGSSKGIFSLFKDEINGNITGSFLGKSFSEIKQQWNEAQSIQDKIKGLFTSRETIEANKKLAEQFEIDKQAVQSFADEYAKAFKKAEISTVALNEITKKTMLEASNSAKEYVNNTNASSISVEDFTNKQKNLNSSIKATTISTNLLKIGTIALNAAISFGLSVAIELLIKKINEWATAEQRAIEKSNELIKSHEEQTKTLNDNSKTIKSIKQDYQTLSKGVNQFGENLSLTTEEYQKYNEITNKIAEMFPTLVEGRTAEGNAIIKQKGNVEALTQALKEQRQELNNNLLINQEDIFKGFKTKVKDRFSIFDYTPALLSEKQAFDAIIKDIDNYDKLFANEDNIFNSSFVLGRIGIQASRLGNFNDVFDTIQKNKNLILSHYRSIVSEINQEIGKIKPIMVASLENNDEYNKLPQDIQNYVKNVLSGINATTLSEFKNALDMNTWIDQNILTPIANNRNNVQDKLSELFNLDASQIPADEYISTVNSLVQQISDALNLDPVLLKAKLGFSSLSAQINETTVTMPELKKEMDSLDISFNSIEKSINNIVSSLSLLDDTIKKVENSTALSGQEISKLILQYPELADSIRVTSQGYTFEIEVLQKVREAKINEQKVAIEAELNKTRQTLDSISARIKGYQWEIGAINSVAEARQALNEVSQLQKSENWWQKLWRGITGRPQISKVKADLEEYINLSDRINEAQNRIKALNTSLALTSMPNYTSASNKAVQATKDHSKALNDNKKVLDNQKKALDEQRKAFEQQKKTLEDNRKSINNLVDITVKMIKRQKETEKDALKESIDGYKTKIDLMKKSLDTQKDEYNYQKELENKNKSINKIQNKLNALQFDDSAEAQRKRKELQDKLKNEQDDLDKFLYDNGVERQKQALDEEYNQFKDNTNKQIKTIEDYLSHEGQLRQDAMNLIEGRTQEFYNNLMRWNVDYGDGMVSTVVNAWDNAYEALERFNSGQINVSDTLDYISSQMLVIDNNISGINAQIDSITARINNANNAMNNFANSSLETAKALNIASQEYRHLANEQRQQAIERENEVSRLKRMIDEMESKNDLGIEPARSYYKRLLNPIPIVESIPGANSNKQQVKQQIKKDWLYNNISPALSMLKQKIFGYARGTPSAKQGLATVNEKGIEAILSKSKDGKFRFMNEGDVVFSKEATKKLWDFANNKANFIGQQAIPKNILGSSINNNQVFNSVSSPIINIDIKGNADVETVNALRRESDKIIKKAVEMTFKTANKQARIM